MATIKQKKAVDILVGNGGNVTQAMRKAEYREATVNTPQKLTESKGYKELLREYGLTEGLITKSLVSDIRRKPKRRIMELNLGAEILGMKKREGEGSRNQIIIVNVSPEIAEKYALNPSPSDNSEGQA